MQYYKATDDRQSARLNYHTFVKNELYTKKELEKIGIQQPGPFFVPVYISRKKIYWFFGVRFAANN